MMPGRQKRLFAIILGLCPVLIVLGIFMGGGNPAGLFEPAQRGILEVRLWRVALGALVGMALAVSGAVLQGVLRNPLAEPYVLGLSSGAGLGTALCILAGGLALGPMTLPVAGFLGAIVSLVVVYSLARVGRVTAAHTLILAGVVWSAVCGSALMFLVSQSSAEGIHAILWWFLGDLQVFDPDLVVGVSWLILAALLALSFLARDLNALMLGDEMAGCVGIKAERTKILLLGLAAIITAASVSVSGLIAFVGLTAPHAARALVGSDHRRLLPAAALIGASFLVVADGLGRALFFPVEIPVGVITAFVGGPFFLLLLRQRQREIWS